MPSADCQVTSATQSPATASVRRSLRDQPVSAVRPTRGAVIQLPAARSLCHLLTSEFTSLTAFVQRLGRATAYQGTGVSSISLIATLRPESRITNDMQLKSLSLSLPLPPSLRFNGHFPGEPGLAGIY